MESGGPDFFCTVFISTLLLRRNKSLHIILVPSTHMARNRSYTRINCGRCVESMLISALTLGTTSLGTLLRKHLQNVLEGEDSGKHCRFIPKSLVPAPTPAAPRCIRRTCDSLHRLPLSDHVRRTHSDEKSRRHSIAPLLCPFLGR